jgi:hypothetical protein
MTTKIAWIPAAAGAVVCVAGAFAYWGSSGGRGVLTSLLILLALLGVIGLWAGILAAKRSSAGALTAIWVVCGVLFATISVTVMSIAPLACAAVVAFGVAALLARPRSRRSIARHLLLVFACAFVSFVPLFLLVTRAGVERVEVSDASLISETIASFDYADAFSVEVPTKKSRDLEEVLEAFVLSLRPWWVGVPKKTGFEDIAMEPGAELGDWKVYRRAENEIILGFNREFIDLRISVLLSSDRGVDSITAITVARYNNWRGSLYFLPVRFGHQIVLAETMRRLSGFLER